MRYTRGKKIARAGVKVGLHRARVSRARKRRIQPEIKSFPLLGFSFVRD